MSSPGGLPAEQSRGASIGSRDGSGLRSVHRSRERRDHVRGSPRTSRSPWSCVVGRLHQHAGEGVPPVALVRGEVAELHRVPKAGGATSSRTSQNGEGAQARASVAIKGRKGDCQLHLLLVILCHGPSIARETVLQPLLCNPRQVAPLAAMRHLGGVGYLVSPFPPAWNSPPGGRFSSVGQEALARPVNNLLVSGHARSPCVAGVPVARLEPPSSLVLRLSRGPGSHLEGRQLRQGSKPRLRGLPQRPLIRRGGQVFGQTPRRPSPACPTCPPAGALEAMGVVSRLRFLAPAAGAADNYFPRSRCSRRGCLGGPHHDEVLPLLADRHALGPLSRTAAGRPRLAAGSGSATLARPPRLALVARGGALAPAAAEHLLSHDGNPSLPEHDPFSLVGRPAGHRGIRRFLWSSLSP